MWCVLTWHFSGLHTKPSGAQCTGVGACQCLCASAYVCLCAHMCVHANVGDTFLLTHSPLVIHPGHSLWDPTAITGRTEGETALIRTVHLVGLQHPNCKIVSCIERIILNYSELKFKFHFVLALSNGQNCLDEISKGQGELKCLLYGLSGRESVS